MTIKELKKILEQAPNPDVNCIYIPRGGKGGYEATTKIVANYDDVGDLELAEGKNI